jgi:hypothetical protein
MILSAFIFWVMAAIRKKNVVLRKIEDTAITF